MLIIAIVFIQKFSGNTTYSRATDENGTLATTGALSDEVCKINGMASNCHEWTTETHSYANHSCVFRGYMYTCLRGYPSDPSDPNNTVCSNSWDFRPLLYW